MLIIQFQGLINTYCKIISEMIEEKERQIEIQRKGLKLKREQEERANQEMGIFYVKLNFISSVCNYM